MSAASYMTTLTTFNILSLIVGSAAWLTALVSLLSLLTLKRQNRLAIKPHLTPVRQHITSRNSDHGRADWVEDVRATTEQSDGVELEKADGVRIVAMPDRKTYAIRLFNLGGGAAKNISVAWEADIQGLVSLAQKLAREAFEDSYWELHDNTMLRFKQRNGAGAFFMVTNCLTSHHDYILPSAIERTGCDILLPNFYPPLVTSIVKLMAARKSDNDLDLAWKTLEGVAPLKLHLNYEDIPGNAYTVAFRCKLNMHAMMGSGHFDASLVPIKRWDKPAGNFMAKLLRFTKRLR